MKFPNLFKPGKIGAMEVRNRTIQAPHGGVYREYQGFMPERVIEYHVMRAKGGVGLIEPAMVAIDRALGMVHANALCIDDDKYITNMANLAESVHFWGAKICMQLVHVGRNVDISATEGRQPVSASATTYISPGGGRPITARALSPDEIAEVEQKYAQGAYRAKLAGFDAIELHSAFGHSLIAQFLSPYTNKRTDHYGGSLENRMRFALEVIQQTREKVGVDFPIIFRFSADEYVPEGITLPESKLIAKKLEEAGVDALHVTGGHIDSMHRVMPPMGTAPEGCFVHFAEEIKKLVTIPIITGGMIRDPEIAERIIEEGKADFVSMVRQLMADPEWPNKARLGKLDEIRTCLACNWGCVSTSSVVVGRNHRCTVNAVVGHENDYKITPVPKRRKVMVIGGGPAGMETARIAALRCHEVILFEKEKQLGGQLHLAAASLYKTDNGYLTKYLTTQMEKLKIAVRPEQEATPETIKEINPDVVVIATGAVPLLPQIPGINDPKVYSAWDVLAARVEVKGEKVVVAGAGSIGFDVAEFLALKGKKITMIDKLAQAGAEIESLTRRCFLERFAKYEVRILTERNILEITEKGVTVEDKKSQKQNIEADSIVVALGSESNNGLSKALWDSPIETYTIGDAAKPRKILDAIAEGWFIGRQI